MVSFKMFPLLIHYFEKIFFSFNLYDILLKVKNVVGRIAAKLFSAGFVVWNWIVLPSMTYKINFSTNYSYNLMASFFFQILLNE